MDSSLVPVTKCSPQSPSEAFSNSTQMASGNNTLATEFLLNISLPHRLGRMSLLFYLRAPVLTFMENKTQQI